MNKKGFTLIEVIGIIALLSIVLSIATPIVIDVVEDSRETNRKNKVKAYVGEVYKAYMLTITEDEFYFFNGEEKGGITENNVINFTNSWLEENVLVVGITCNTENIYSNVFYDLNSDTVKLNECTVDDKYKYSYINEEILKH